MARLTMLEFLQAVAEHDRLPRLVQEVPETLRDRGYHPKVVIAKAEKAVRHGYTDFGVVVDRPWLTDKGRAFIADNY